jgi:hypothetical protein
VPNINNSTPPSCVAFQTIRHDTVVEFVAHVHAVFASCPISKFLHMARAGWLGNYPRLTPLMIQQNAPVCRNTAMAYLDQTKQGQRSTKSTSSQHRRQRKRKQPRQPTPLAGMAETCTDDFDAPHVFDDAESPHLCFQVMTTTEFNNSSGATGKFPFPTLSGFNYILVSATKGYVHFELMRERTAAEYRRVYKAMYAFYAALGKTPTTQRLDNESSAELEEFLRETKVNIHPSVPADTLRM